MSHDLFETLVNVGFLTRGIVHVEYWPSFHLWFYILCSIKLSLSLSLSLSQKHRDDDEKTSEEKTTPTDSTHNEEASLSDSTHQQEEATPTPDNSTHQQEETTPTDSTHPQRDESLADRDTNSAAEVEIAGSGQDNEPQSGHSSLPTDTAEDGTPVKKPRGRRQKFKQAAEAES